MTSINNINFSYDGYESQGEQESGRVRVWFTPDGDKLSLHFFPLVPDLPQDAESADQIKLFYQSMLGDSGAKVVETSIISIDECAAVQVIISMPQQPSGRFYIASVTLPFRDFSYVLKVQCAEHGTTGIKEAILGQRSMEEGKTSISDGKIEVLDWNPDSEEYDTEFPNHPIARARLVLGQVQQSVTLTNTAKQSSKFPLPQLGS